MLSISYISKIPDKIKRKSEDIDSYESISAGNALINAIPRKKVKIEGRNYNPVPQTMQLERRIEKENVLRLTDNIGISKKMIGPTTALIMKARLENNSLRRYSAKSKESEFDFDDEFDFEDKYALSESDVEYVIELYKTKRAEKKLHDNEDMPDSDVKVIVDIYMQERGGHDNEIEGTQKDKWIVRNDVKNMIHMHEFKIRKENNQAAIEANYIAKSESIRDTLKSYDGGEDLVEMIENYTIEDYEGINLNIRNLYKNGFIEQARALSAPYKEAVDTLIKNKQMVKEEMLCRGVGNHGLFQERKISYDPAPQSFSIIKEKAKYFAHVDDPIIIGGEEIEMPPGAIMHAFHVEAAYISAISGCLDEVEALGKPDQHFDIIGKFWDEKMDIYQVIAEKIDEIKIPKKRRNSI